MQFISTLLKKTASYPWSESNYFEGSFNKENQREDHVQIGQCSKVALIRRSLVNRPLSRFRILTKLESKAHSCLYQCHCITVYHHHNNSHCYYHHVIIIIMIMKTVRSRLKHFSSSLNLMSCRTNNKIQ